MSTCRPLTRGLSNDSPTPFVAKMSNSSTAEAIRLSWSMALNPFDGHQSVQALEADIRAWAKAWNEDPRPFIWAKTAEQILESLGRLLQRIRGEGHLVVRNMTMIDERPAEVEDRQQAGHRATSWWVSAVDRR